MIMSAAARRRGSHPRGRGAPAPPLDALPLSPVSRHQFARLRTAASAAERSVTPEGSVTCYEISRRWTLRRAGAPAYAERAERDRAAQERTSRKSTIHVSPIAR